MQHAQIPCICPVKKYIAITIRIMTGVGLISQVPCVHNLTFVGIFWRVANPNIFGKLKQYQNRKSMFHIFSMHIMWSNRSFWGKNPFFF